MASIKQMPRQLPRYLKYTLHNFNLKFDMCLKVCRILNYSVLAIRKPYKYSLGPLLCKYYVAYSIKDSLNDTTIYKPNQTINDY